MWYAMGLVLPSSTFASLTCFSFSGDLIRAGLNQTMLTTEVVNHYKCMPLRYLHLSEVVLYMHLLRLIHYVTFHYSPLNA